MQPPVQGRPPGGGGVSDHDLLNNLAFVAAGHTGFVASGGVAGGQTIKGGTAASENLELESTAHATKGQVRLKDDLLLAAGKAIKDSGGTNRYLPQASTPHNTLYGDTHIEDYLEIASSRGGVDSHLWIVPTRSDHVGGMRGATVSPDVRGATGAGGVACTGIFGQARLTPAIATTGHVMKGLNFTSIGQGGGAGTVIANLMGMEIIPLTIGYTGTITEAHGMRLTNFIVVGGDVITYYNQENQGALLVSGTIQDAYGIKQADISGMTGFCRLLEIGAPYLRVIGGGNPAANQTNVYIQEQATLRHVQWKDGAAIGGGDRVMVLV